MIVTKGYGAEQMIVSQGYGTSTPVIMLREVLRLTSEIRTTLEVESIYDF